MLHIDDSNVRGLLLKGNFGLEKEALRVTPLGLFTQTKHPFMQLVVYKDAELVFKGTKHNHEYIFDPAHYAGLSL